jgi:hypothetical protein
MNTASSAWAEHPGQIDRIPSIVYFINIIQKGVFDEKNHGYFPVFIKCMFYYFSTRKNYCRSIG